jgi:peroxin-1
LATDITSEYLAAQTEGYSGADLQALLYNAHLNAIHDIVDLEGNADQTGKKDKENGTVDIEFFQMNSPEWTNGSTNQDLVDKAMMATKLDKIMRDTTIEDNQESAVRNEEVEVIIQHKHIDEALQDTKPSISVSEKAKLETIYAQFVSGRSGEMPTGTASNDIGGRTTLM